MGTSITALAPAKLNLALHVLRRRADGYHELDSLVAFAPDAADEVSLTPAAAFSLDVEGPLAAGVPRDDSNLALRAAQEMARRWPRHFGPVEVRLRKNLPSAAGIGGGSADAAAVIHAMCALFGFLPAQEELGALALKLGADVPVCLHGRAARMGGIGEDITALAELPETFCLLANPGVALSTAQVFGALHETSAMSGAPLPDALLAEHADAASLAEALRRARNDLQAPACILAPAVKRCLTTLRGLPGVLLARMSGSGATCLALFAERQMAEEALRELRAEQPDWWLAVSRLR